MNRCLKCNTENAPDADYCIKCGFSLWRDAPPADRAPEPPTKIMRVIHLHPEVVRVRRGGHATIAAHIHGEPHANVQWEIEGNARSFASLQPTDEGLIIDLRPGADEPGWASPLEVRCLEEGEVAGLATGTVEVVGEPAVARPPVGFDSTSAADDSRAEDQWQPPKRSWEERQPEPDREALRRRQAATGESPDTDQDSAGEGTTAILRTVPRDQPNTPLITQIVVLSACGLFLLLVLLVKHYVTYEGEAVSLFTATKSGGDSSSPLFPADFWTVTALVVVILALGVVSFAGARRSMMGLAAILGLLVLAQLTAIAGTGHSLREVVHINPHGQDHPHAVGAAFWASMILAGAMSVAALAGAVAPNRDTTRSR
jgi:hypothetical protein